MDLVDSLIVKGWLKTPRLIEAFRKIKRVDFLPDEFRDLADLDEALPIGFNQTISQPLTVAFMLELLQPQPDEKILDIGSGSGWTTALLAEIVGPKGKVIALELIPELMEWGRQNVAKYGFIEKRIAQFICADGSRGYGKEAPYNKILASASIQGKLPQAWKEQLRVGGRIVSPIGNSIWLFIKKSQTEFEEKEFPGFVFVPLIAE
jgi:protein-L-isoaspartate(D-aspartate) O-methyltransferase